MKRFCLVYSLLFIYHLAFTQNHFWGKAIITDTLGNSTIGYIELKGEEKMKHKISFSTQSNGENSKVFFPSQLKQFVLLSDSSTFEPVEFSQYKKDTTLTKFFFGKTLLKGYCNLYFLALTTEINTVLKQDQKYAFVIRKEGKDYTLSQYETLSSDHHYKLFNKYVGVMNFLFQDEPILKAEINNARFNAKSILSIVERYNNKKEGTQKIIAKSNKTKYYKNYGIRYERVMNSNEAYNPIRNGVTAFYEFQKSNKNHRVTSLVGLKYSDYKTDVAYAPFQLIIRENYLFTPQKKIKLYATGGVNFYYPFAPILCVGTSATFENIRIGFESEIFFNFTPALYLNIGISLYDFVK